METEREARFEFGANWSRFLRVLTPERIEVAEASLREMLGVERLDGKRFLDIGSGSGLLSLAARRLGATVHSFDYDRQSVACTAELRRRYFPDDDAWRVEQGSALDAAYLEGLGAFDVVYSWGVLHHTGNMRQALDNAARCVAPGGMLFIALYNDQGGMSEFWKRVKRIYVGLPRPLRVPYAVLVTLPFEVRYFAKELFAGRPGHYIRTWTQYQMGRGMSRWHDIIDWVGGYPFEVARPDDVLRFYADRGFSPLRTKLTTDAGCNEFVLVRDGARG